MLEVGLRHSGCIAQHVPRFFRGSEGKDLMLEVGLRLIIPFDAVPLISC